MNNQVQFVCLWCYILPYFVVQLNNFCSLVLFSTVIHQRRGKKLVSKTIKYKWDSFSDMKFVFFILKSCKKFFQRSGKWCKYQGAWVHVLCVIIFASFTSKGNILTSRSRFSKPISEQSYFVKKKDWIWRLVMLLRRVTRTFLGQGSFLGIRALW